MAKRKTKKKAKKKSLTSKVKRATKTKTGRAGIGAGAGALVLGPIGAVGGALYGASTGKNPKKNPTGRRPKYMVATRHTDGWEYFYTKKDLISKYRQSGTVKRKPKFETIGGFRVSRPFGTAERFVGEPELEGLIGPMGLEGEPLQYMDERTYELNPGGPVPNVSAFEPGRFEGTEPVEREEGSHGRMRRSPSPGHRLAKVKPREIEVALAETMPIDNPVSLSEAYAIHVKRTNDPDDLREMRDEWSSWIDESESPTREFGREGLRAIKRGISLANKKLEKMALAGKIKNPDYVGQLRKRKVRKAASSAGRAESAARGVRAAKVREILAANPLAPGYEPSVISGNIRELIRSGMPQKQAIAAAYSHARQTSPKGMVPEATNPGNPKKTKVVRRKGKPKSLTKKEKRELEEELKKYDLAKVKEAEMKGNPRLKTQHEGYDPFGFHGDFGQGHPSSPYVVLRGEAVFDEYYLQTLDSMAEELGYYDIAKPIAKFENFKDAEDREEYTALDVLVAARSAPANTLRQLAKELDKLARLHRDEEQTSETLAHAADTMRSAAKDAGKRQRANPSKKKLTKIPVGVEIKRLPPGKAEGAELPGEFAGGIHEGKHPGGRKRKQRPLAMGIGVRAFGTANPKKTLSLSKAELAERMERLEKKYGSKKAVADEFKRRRDEIRKKKVSKKAKKPEWKRLIDRCQKLWESYCARPSKKRLRLVLAHLEKMKASTSAKVKSERSRCLRAAKAEAKSLKMKI